MVRRGLHAHVVGRSIAAVRVGVDLSPEMAARAVEKAAGTQITVVCGDVEDSAAVRDSGPYDVVMFYNAFPHFPDPAGLSRTLAGPVRPGGRLVYATCSLFTEENEAQVDAFLSRTPGFAVVPLERAWALDAPAPGAGPYLSLTPRSHATDGFFGAVLERAA